MNSHTPTESLIGYDAEGIPPTHTQPAARRHTDLHDDSPTPCATCGKMLTLYDQFDPGDDDYKKLCRPCFTFRLSEERRNDDTRILPVLKGRTQAALESVGYQEPVLQPVEPRNLDDLDKILETYRLNRDHVCRGCACPLQPSQPCGAYCSRCAEELAALEADCRSAFWPVLFWVLVATFALWGIADLLSYLFFVVMK